VEYLILRLRGFRQISLVLPEEAFLDSWVLQGRGQSGIGRCSFGRLAFAEGD
jgi:hypothetical protein